MEMLAPWNILYKAPSLSSFAAAPDFMDLSEMVCFDYNVVYSE
jgi:hypothetical protein